MHTLKHTKILFKKNDGYDIIQMAIAILILGLIMAPAAALYNNYKSKKKYDDTFRSVQVAVDRVQTQRRLSGAYPCPAPLNVPRNDPGYGRATNCRTDPAITALAPGSCAQGVCVEQSIRAALANRRVIVGALPFRDLRIEERATYDGYGSRLVYAVTESLTDQATFNEGNGGIAIRKEDGVSPAVTPDGAGDFLVLSHGPTRIGGYTLEGALTQQCTGVGRDLENCNDGFRTGAAVSPDSIYVTSREYSAAGNAFFDDQIIYFSQVATPMWRRTTANNEDIEELAPNFTGIGTNAPATQLHISTFNTAGLPDALRVSQDAAGPASGKILTDRLCDETGANCIDVRKLASDTGVGAPNRLVCPAGQYMTGIENNAPVCAPDFSVICPAATPVLYGVNPATGAADCRPMPQNCGASTVNRCSTNINLPLSAEGTIIPINAGSCYTSQYVCSGGNWVETNIAGYCNFTPTPYTCPCGYTGTYYSSCSGGNTFATDCACAATASCSESALCTTIPRTPPDQPWSAGLAYRTNTHNMCAVTYGAWDTTLCNCPSPTGTPTTIVNLGCPSGYLGTRTRLDTWNSISCVWMQGAVTDNCTCNLNPPPYAVPKTCADPVCDEPDVPDIFQDVINAANCTAVPPPTLVSPGSCKPKTFRWVETNNPGSTTDNRGANPIMINTGCTCAEHQSTLGPSVNTQVTCYNPTQTVPPFDIYQCRCQ